MQVRQTHAQLSDFFPDNAGLTYEGMLQGIREHKPKLLVLSPIISFLSGLSDINSEQEVRAALMSLNAVTSETGTAVIGIGHLNKKADLDAVDRLLGSVAFINFVRSVIMIGPDRNEEGAYRVLHAKHNCSPRGNDLIYRILSARAGEHEQALRLECNVAESNIEPSDFYRRQSDKERLVDQCEDWLFELLQAGPMERQHVITSGEGMFTRITIDRAKAASKRVHSRYEGEGEDKRVLWYTAPLERSEK